MAQGWVGKYRDPLVRLKLALYGHPDSGGYWEQKCDSHPQQVGFKPIVDWRSCYDHEVLNLFLIVYVDDFKLCGPTENLNKCWAMMRKGIYMDEPALLGKCLGCDHVAGAASLNKGELRPMWSATTHRVLTERCSTTCPTSSASVSRDIRRLGDPSPSV